MGSVKYTRSVNHSYFWTFPGKDEPVRSAQVKTSWTLQTTYELREISGECGYHKQDLTIKSCENNNLDLRRWTVVEIVGLVHFGYKRYMFFFAFKGPGCWGRCHFLSPVEPRDRNRMMDNNKVMSRCFDAFCFRLVGHLRTSKYVSRSSPVSLTCKPPIMLLCCGFVTRCSCN